LRPLLSQLLQRPHTSTFVPCTTLFRSDRMNIQIAPEDERLDDPTFKRLFDKEDNQHFYQHEWRVQHNRNDDNREKCDKCSKKRRKGEHTSEIQSSEKPGCRPLVGKKKG